MSNSSNPHIFARIFCRKKKQNIDIASAEFEATFPKNVTDLKHYTCDLCNFDLELRRTEHPRYRVKAYFAHKRNSSTCVGSTGESFKHLHAKFLLKRFYGAYDICLEECVVCGPHTGFVPLVTDELLIELRKTMPNNKTYIFDTCVARNLGKTRGKQHVLAIEVFNTHKTEEKKIDDTRESGLEIAEVDAQTVIGMQNQLEHAKKNNYRITIPNLLTFSDTCKKCKRAQATQAAQEEFDKEFIYDGFTESTWRLQMQQNTQRYAYEDIEVQQRGKFLAEQKFQKIKQRPSKKIKFSKENRKCKLCNTWHPPDSLHRVSADHWDNIQFEKMHEWHTKNFVKMPYYALLCSDCCISCEMCKKIEFEFPTLRHMVPVPFAKEHGMCYWCLQEIQRKK